MGTAVTNWINLVGTTITNWANATFSTGGSSGVSSFGGATGAITLLSSQLAMSGNELYSLCQIGSSTLSNFVANITVNASGQFTNSPWCLFTNTFSSWTVTSNGWVFTTTNGETVACTNGIVYASGGFQSGGSGTGTLSALSGNLTLNASTGLIVIQTNDNVLGSEYVNTNLYASNAVVTNSVTVNGAGNSGTAGFIGNGFGITNVWDTNVNVACVTNQIQTNSFHGTAANDYTNWWLNVATNHVYRCSLQTNNAAYCLTNLQGLVAGQDNWVDLYLQNTNSAANITLWWATGVTTPVTGYIPILNGFTNGLLITNSQGWFHLHGDIYGTNYMSNATWEASWPSL
jgi:hypothetical protein